MINGNERECLACGEVHNGKTCPIIMKKIEKYYKSSKRNYLMGNILLECIRNEVDFLQILLEIAEQNEEVSEIMSVSDTACLPIEGAIEYFAASINCRSRDFFREPEKTAEEYAKLLGLDSISDICLLRDDDKNTYSIEMGVSISGYQNINTIRSFGVWGMKGYKCTLAKEPFGKNSWIYKLHLDIPVAIHAIYTSPKIRQNQPRKRTYCWASMDEASSTSFLLVSEERGRLTDFFESVLNSYWTEDNLVIECPYDDSRFDIWMGYLEKATEKSFMEWKKGKNRYYSKYGDIDIEIHINQELEYGDSDILYVRNQPGGVGLRFGHRDEKVYFSQLKSERRKVEEGKTIPRIRSLSQKIDQLIRRDEGELCVGLPSVEIKHTDVVVVTQSFVCHDQNHAVKPLRGIVQILTPNNEQMSYEIYVGYCKACNRYYVFRNSFDIMLKVGKPLCAVYYGDKRIEENQYVPFKYKSQSVLNAMGYNVGLSNDLSAETRQSILVDALQKGMFDVHDLLNFLNWLINTRKTQSKYKEAVRKWTEDVKFVENYEKGKRDVVEIDAITVK